MPSPAVILLSGGLDSATTLAIARARGFDCHAISFDYGQRHRVELDARPRILEALRRGFPGWAARLGEDHLLDIAVLGRLAETALTRDVGFRIEANGLPNSFVPGRNLVFLTLAAALAYRRGLRRLVAGVCETGDTTSLQISVGNGV